MSKLKTLAIPVLVLIFSFTTAVPVFAHADEKDGVGDSAAEAKERANQLKEKYSKQAQEKVEAAKEKTKEKTTEARQKACTARKSAIEKRLSVKVTLAEKHKTAFDRVFTKVQNFYNQKGLSVENYDALVEAVEDAQADATSKISALKSVDITVDCTQTNVAEKVSTFSEAMKATRDSLKTYKSALKELVKAVRDAAKTSESNQGGNQ